MSELLKPDDTRDALRLKGGLLLGLGVLMWLLRKSGEIGDFVELLLYAALAALLFGGALLTRDATGGLRPWQSAYSVFGLVFVPLALLQFVDLVGGDPGAGLNTFWVFGTTAALAFAAALLAGVRFQLLAGSIALIVSWSALWSEILSGGLSDHFGVYRGLLGILAIALLAGALHLWRTDAGAKASQAGDDGLWKASELLTGAGISAVLGCSLGITAAANLAAPFPLLSFEGIDTSVFWDVLLLLISLGLVAIGATIGTRGPVYVGAIGLVLFLAIAGLDLDGSPPDPTSFGLWPLVLMVLGAVGIVVSLTAQASLGDRPRKFLSEMRKR